MATSRRECTQSGRGGKHIAHAARRCADWRQAVASVLLVGLLAAAPALAVAPAELMDRDLEVSEVSITALHNGQLTYFGSDRQLTRSPISRFVQLRLIAAPEDAAAEPDSSAEPAPAPAGTGHVQLVDGQVLAGAWAGPATGGDALRWRHATLGEVVLPLEQIRRIAFAPAGAAAPQAENPADDSVLLANGDALIGFVDAVGPLGVQFTPNGGSSLALPFDRLKTITFANPPAPAQAAHTLLLLRDGSRLRVSDLALASDTAQFSFSLREDAEGAPPIPLAQVSQINFAASGEALTNLLDQPRTVEAGGRAFGVPMLPHMQGERLWIHAPVTVAIELPPGARRVALRASLATEEIAALGKTEWADVELLMHLPGGETHRVHLDSGQPVVRINQPLSASSDTSPATLRIELEPAVNGPILDRVWIDQAILLVAPSAEPLSAAKD